jgi:hypothetical protein
MLPSANPGVSMEAIDETQDGYQRTKMRGKRHLGYLDVSLYQIMGSRFTGVDVQELNQCALRQYGHIYLDFGSGV